MPTEPGLGALLIPSRWGWIVCWSLASPAPPLSPPQPPPHTAARGAGSHRWELKELAPGSGPAVELLLAMKFLFPRPAHLVRGEACLPCQLSPWLFPRLCFPHAPSPFPFLQYSGQVDMGPASCWLLGRAKSPCSAPAVWRPRYRDCGWAAWCGRPGQRWVTPSWHCLLCFCSSCQQIFTWPFPKGQGHLCKQLI